MEMKLYAFPIHSPATHRENVGAELCHTTSLDLCSKVWWRHAEFSRSDLMAMTQCGVYPAASACMIQSAVLMGADQEQVTIQSVA